MKSVINKKKKIIIYFNSYFDSETSIERNDKCKK